MAITAESVINNLRVGDTTQERQIVDRMLPAAQALVEKHAPNAPETIQEEAIYRLVASWFDQPNAHTGAAYANAFRNSGAQAILAPYRVLKARTTP